jgi:hypothetical protein
VIAVILVGVALPIVVANGDVPVIIRGEPRGAIVAFLAATLWNFAHLEWLLHQHGRVYEYQQQQKNDKGDMPDQGHGEETMPDSQQLSLANRTPAQVLQGLRFASSSSSSSSVDLVWAHPGQARVALTVLLLASTALLVAGSVLELISFTSVLGGETMGCPRRYTLYTLGAALVSDFALTDNAAPFAIWVLCLAYFVFVGVVPWLVHMVHVLFFLGRVAWPAAVFEITNVAWTVASIEALLLSVIALQVRFSDSERCVLSRLLARASGLCCHPISSYAHFIIGRMASHEPRSILSRSANLLN